MLQENSQTSKTTMKRKRQVQQMLRKYKDKKWRRHIEEVKDAPQDHWRLLRVMGRELL